MAKKKISRKELLKKEDEFLTFSARVLKFVLEHKVQIASIAGLFIGLGLLVSTIQYFSNKSENKSFALMKEGLFKYEEALKDKEPKEAYLGVKPDFEQIMNEYAGKQGGKLARIVYANISYNGGEADTAIDLYEKALNDFGDNLSLRNFILSGLGYAYEAKKDYAKAIEYFKRIDASSNPTLKDEALFNLGRLYAETGEKDKSREAYKKLIADYADSMYIEIAKERVAG